MTLAIIYARYSPRPNGREETIELQVERCRSYAKAMGLECDESLVFADRMLSGKSIEGRDGLAAALEAMEERRGSTLMVYSLSRLARNTREALELAERIQKAGCNLVCLQERFDTTTPTGRMLFTVCAAIAQLEREQTAQRTSDGLQHLKRNGCRVGVHAQYGWRLPDEIPAERDGGLELVPDDGEQVVLRHIVSGARAVELNSMGFRNRGGGKWRSSEVKRIRERSSLKNTKTFS